jgi:hypothetical protein
MMVNAYFGSADYDSEGKPITIPTRRQSDLIAAMGGKFMVRRSDVHVPYENYHASR